MENNKEVLLKEVDVFVAAKFIAEEKLRTNHLKIIHRINILYGAISLVIILFLFQIFTSVQKSIAEVKRSRIEILETKARQDSLYNEVKKLVIGINTHTP